MKEESQPESRTSEPAVHTIRAGFAGEEAGTRSRLDFDETYAKVLWTGGDSFNMYKMSTGGYSQTTYTTEDDGTEVATFTSTKRLSEDDSYTSIYPAQQYGVYRKNDDILLRIPVPPVQTAVPGGIAEGLNFAAAWSSTQDADLQFNNLLSVIRFRLEGDAVSSLQSIIFDAGTTVAGDAALYFQEGELKFGYTLSFGASVTYERSNTVTLSGSFVEGQDYCIAMVPASLTGGFTLTFSDGEGHFIEKHSSKALTLKRSRIVDFGTIDLGDTWSSDDQVIRYFTQTMGRKKNVVAVLADGFRAEELDLFESLAKDAIDYMFSVEPYKTYQEYFTVYLCRVASNESGAGYTDESGKILTPVDNYFGSRWPEKSYSNMTANEETVKSYLSSHIPEIVSGELAQKDVPAVLLINDNRYGGICHVYGTGWSYAQVPYQYAGRSIRWSFPSVQAVNVQDDSEGSRPTTDEEKDEMGRMVGDWRNTFLHEFGGHGYGRLTDEYWSSKIKYTKPGDIAGHTYTVKYALNVSGYYDSVPWKADLLDHLDEWTARNPDYGRISIWHGGHTSLYYRWRSEKTSCMIDNRPYYSTWQRILIVRKIMEKTGETFDMDEFIAKDVTVDPIRPVVSATASPEERSQILMRARSQALLVPEMPMLPPPVLEDE
jgi:IgA Peptidase M64.